MGRLVDLVAQPAGCANVNISNIKQKPTKQTLLRSMLTTTCRFPQTFACIVQEMIATFVFGHLTWRWLLLMADIRTNS